MATKTFTRKEVAEHNKNKDCWFIIHNEVRNFENNLARYLYDFIDNFEVLKQIVLKMHFFYSTTAL